MMATSLQIILRSNAAFSFGSGLGMMLFNKEIASFMGLQWPSELVSIGIALIFFAAFLVWVARKSKPNRNWVVTIIIQDIFWVLGSIIIIVTQAFGLFSQGYWLIGIIACIVMVFAFLQLRNIIK